MLVSLRVSELRVYEADRGTGEILDRLAGQRAAVTGQLAPAASGYDGTTVVISVSAVKPMDAIGERALRGKLPVINTLDTYDAAIRTGPRLAVEAKDPKSGKPRRPVKEYVDYWLTPTGVLWASCRDGYALRSGRISPAESGECDGQQCSLSKPLYETVTLTFRCEKKLQK